MTEQTQPTDAEILDTADDFRSQYKHGGTTFDEFDALGFARAVLAKWGTPAGAGEPVASITTTQISRMFRNLDGLDPNQWGTHHAKGWNDALRRCMDYATPQPTQAQAGAVPVGFRLVPIEPTVEILQAMDLAFSDAMHVGVPVSPEAYDAIIKAVDAAGIKGADHE